MNKQDMIIVGSLVLLLVFWGQIDQHVFKKVYPDAPTPDSVALEEGAVEDIPVSEKLGSSVENAREMMLGANSEVLTDASVPAEKHILDNGLLRLTASNIGAGITHAELLNFKVNPYQGDEPLDFDFSNRVSLAYAGLDSFTSRDAFKVSVLSGGSRILLSKTRADGLMLERTFMLDEDYGLQIKDVFSNVGRHVVKVAAHEVQMGAIHKLKGGNNKVGVTVGFDVCSQDLGEVTHVGKKILGWIKDEGQGEINLLRKEPVQWIALKNKFFTHIFSLGNSELEAAYGYRLRASADEKGKQISETSGALAFPAFLLDVGQSYERSFTYHVMPKKFDALKQMPNQQAEVMQFPPIIKPISKMLLNLLNFIHGHIPPYNYGLAIILLTVLVRVVFWPLTHKGTESMKRMQALGPEMKALREKHKDNPQQQQQELMALYKREKINPLGGCLPMLVQMPVFIALFYVLRSAVELRFAPFLWIKDLSEQEALFAGTVPFAINILPFAMAATMFVQQRLTPQTGDPQQQKIMAFFPFILLVFMYSMPSGLLLYWTTSNALMIVQQVFNLKQKSKKEAAKAA